jgi:hypothetical protein
MGTNKAQLSESVDAQLVDPFRDHRLAAWFLAPGAPRRHPIPSYWQKERPMRIDLYTRTVLTVIAVCLLWLCVILTPSSTTLSAQTRTPAGTLTPTQVGAPPAGDQTPASAGVQEVIIVGIKHPGYKPRASALEAPQVNGSWDSLPSYSAQAPPPPR